MIRIGRWARSILQTLRRRVVPEKRDIMRLHRLRSYEDFLEYRTRESSALEHHWSVIRKSVPSDRSAFTIGGYSYTAGKQVSFLVDYQHAAAGGDVLWRERVCCPLTGFNNRMRSTFHIFDIEAEAYPDSSIYVTEQLTPIYDYFRKRYPNVVGSEYLGSTVPYGTTNANGIRNESLCELTFPDESFDVLVSLDVLEHIPDYTVAFRECCRVLKPKGRMLWSVPFVPMAEKNIVRARLTGDGIEHLHPPEFHGDPLSADGILCFTHFGWEMLAQVLAAGFADAYAICFHSLEFGYLGGWQFLFFARK